MQSSEQTIDRAIRGGLNRAAHNLAENGITGNAVASTLAHGGRPYDRVVPVPGEAKRG
jgi:hypothetical protein